MRTITTPVAAICALTLTLSACGEGSAFDESFKASYREKLVSTCVSTAQGQTPEGIEVDLDKICGCAADKIMEGKSTQDLATTVPGGADDLANIRECASEIGPVKIGTGGNG